MQLAVLEADGYAVCPDCGTRVKCGSAGLNNLEKRHRTSEACKNAREKRDKGRKKKNTNLFNYFKGPKAPTVPSIITCSRPIQSHRLAPTQAVDTEADLGKSNESNSQTHQEIETSASDHLGRPPRANPCYKVFCY